MYFIAIIFLIVFLIAISVEHARGNDKAVGAIIGITMGLILSVSMIYGLV